ncbi:hypothetical protein H5991_05720 [Ligilactobacillus agilis]|uniref:hypothetical protein n=1 Tax=Ligilactobacillus agilis TaxID=1601 RepID=UPI00195BBD2E|nr:hypothetical protein [Ligilactobacillus agilis]MBM6773000.1 hypothetical protein [Ligilactobacillus agilis]
MTYVIVKNEEVGACYYRQKDKDFTKDLMAASKWPTVSRAEEILAELSKTGAQELAIEETAKLKQQVKQEQVVKKDTELREYAHQLLTAKDREFYAELERVSRFLAASPYLLEEISAKISQEDGTVLQDLLHTIELGDYRAHEGLALLKDLRASRKKRRYYKDRQQSLTYLLTKTTTGQVTTTSDKAQLALTKLGNLQTERNYNYRNSSLQAKYANLLEKKPVQNLLQLFKLTWQN